MPPSTPPGSPGEWLDRARGKLALVHQGLPSGGFLEDLCFLSQQAAELAIKAVYQQRGWIFPFIHDLGRLLDGLEQRGVVIPPPVQEADQLTVYATQARYPGFGRQVAETEYRQAALVAEAVVGWADTIVADRQGGNKSE